LSGNFRDNTMTASRRQEGEYSPKIVLNFKAEDTYCQETTGEGGAR